MTDKRQTFLIIDSHALIHRAFHALPQGLRAPDGRLINAVYGFTSVLIKVLKELKPSYVVAAFDLAEPTFRHEAFADYKANRAKVDEDLEKQFPLVRQILEAFEIPILEDPGYEADDIIGTLTEKLKDKKNLKKVIVTGDLDTLQLVKGDETVVYTLKRGVNDTIIYNEKQVKERYGGLGPDKITDLKGLKGDPSDNIPGVPGIGEKTAIQLLSRYKNIEDLLENFEEDKDLREGLKKKLLEFKNQALFSKELATIKRDVPLDFKLNATKFKLVLTDKIKRTFGNFGFRTLLKRLTDEVSASTTKSQEVRLIPDELEENFKKGVFSQKIYEIETNLKPVLRHMEKAGVLIDGEVLVKLDKKVSRELVQIKKEVVKLANEDFNLNSPQEVSRILFEKLELGLRRTKKTKTGLASTAAGELEKILDKHPIVPLLLRWRELSKLKSTYLQTLPNLKGVDGRVHTTFKQFGAATGRLASENPNLQNIPIHGEYGREIRKAFIARPGYQLVSADYSQIELRLAAAMSGDKKMIETFKRGEDIHTRTAAEIFNVSFSGVDKNMRRKAKILNFGILYGMGASSFARSAGINRDQAADFIDEYHNDFPGLTKFIKELKEKAYSKGYSETLWGRRRYLPELTSGNPGLRAAGERMAINMPIQGTATGDIIKAAMVVIDKRFSKNEDIIMVLQVHDELVFEIKKEKVKEYTSFIKRAMEEVISLKVPIIVEIEAGPSWGELKPIN